MAHPAMGQDRDAAAGVPWFMEAAGTRFAMKDPFEFAIDPAHLLDD